MKTALVTGANKGIGRKAADEIAKKGGKATFLEIDVSDGNSVTAARRVSLRKLLIISTCS